MWKQINYAWIVDEYKWANKLNLYIWTMLIFKEFFDKHS